MVSYIHTAPPHTQLNQNQKSVGLSHAAQGSLLMVTCLDGGQVRGCRWVQFVCLLYMWGLVWDAAQCSLLTVTCLDGGQGRGCRWGHFVCLYAGRGLGCNAVRATNGSTPCTSYTTPARAHPRPVCVPHLCLCMLPTLGCPAPSPHFPHIFHILPHVSTFACSSRCTLPQAAAHVHLSCAVGNVCTRCQAHCAAARQPCCGPGRHHWQAATTVRGRRPCRRPAARAVAWCWPRRPSCCSC